MTAGAAARRADHPRPGRGTARRTQAATARRGRPLRCHHRDRRRHRRRLDRGRDPAGPPRRPLRPPPRPKPSSATTCSPRRWPRAGSTPPRPARSSPPSTGSRPPASSPSAPSNAQQAETHLVRMAEHHDAKALRILGGRIFEVIAPDLAEKFDGKALEAEEAEALRRTTLTMCEDDEGTCHGRFRIPALHGQMLTKMILAISSPSRSTSDTASSRDRPRPAHPGPPRHRAHPADRDLPRREAARRPAAAPPPSWSR